MKMTSARPAAPGGPLALYRTIHTRTASYRIPGDGFGTWAVDTHNVSGPQSPMFRGHFRGFPGPGSPRALPGLEGQLTEV